MKRSILTLTSAVLALTSACSDPESDAKELYDQALAAEREEDLGLTLAQLEQVMLNYPQTSVATDGNERLTHWIVKLQRNEATAIANLQDLNRAEEQKIELPT